MQLRDSVEVEKAALPIGGSQSAETVHAMATGDRTPNPVMCVGSVITVVCVLQLHSSSSRRS